MAAKPAANTASLVLPAEGTFLVSDVRMASRADERTAAFSRRADNDRRPAAAIVAPSDATFAPYATRLGEAVRVDLPRDNFVDEEPGTLKPSMSGLDVDALRSVAGARVQMITAVSERERVLAEARLSWLFEYLQTDAGTTAFFAPGEKGIFAVQGLKYGSNWAVLGWGFRWELASGLSAYAHYDAQANPLELFHIGSTGFSYAW
jgi:hypothetical protein